MRKTLANEWLLLVLVHLLHIFKGESLNLLIQGVELFMCLLSSLASIFSYVYVTFFAAAAWLAPPTTSLL